MKIGVGFVIYDPDLEVLTSSISRLVNQVDEVLLLVNHIASKNSLKQYREKFGCNIIYNEENCGVAKAYNQIMQYMKEKGCTWVLTMDQDSLCPLDMIQKYKLYLTEKNIGIVCPSLLYKGDIKQLHCKSGYSVVTTCISSASLINCKAWEDVGGFDEALFIDFVDFDFCYLLKEQGYKILQLNNTYIEHQLGELCVKKIFGRKIYVTNHSPLRKYYYIRNAIICKKKHRDYEFQRFFKDIAHSYLKTILYENDKKKSIAMMNKGFVEGIEYKVGKK